MLALFVLVALVFCLAMHEQYSVIHVKPTGSDSNDGLSWAKAKRTIQAALNAARPGDQVWVAAGVYNERITLKGNVELYGGFKGTETSLGQRPSFPRSYPDPYASVLDGGGRGTVVTAMDLGSGFHRIDGFVIQNGQANAGGGIYCKYSSPTISNNKITKNSAGLGGGIYCDYSSPTIQNNTITGNSAKASGGGICCFCSSLTISNNTIAGNSAEEGGGICCMFSSPIISNNTIAANSALAGGGIRCWDSSYTVANNIVAFNSSGISDVYSECESKPNLKCNCFYNPDIYDYSGISPGDCDIQVDPKFCALEYGNFHIRPDSPCVDAGDSSVVQPDWVDIDGQPRIQGAGVDIGADECDGTACEEFVPLIVRVSMNGDDRNDGSSWSKAKRSVQSAIDAVYFAGGGEVWVAAGTYVERITLRPFVHVYGGFAGDETSRDQRNWVENKTILDGNQGGSVVTVENLVYGIARIDGFTIQNGRADHGGGIYCKYSSPTIQNNAITGNNARAGGGGIFCQNSWPTISNNNITENSAKEGGGIYCRNSSPTISSNIITGNRTATDGGGIYCFFSSPRISNNTIAANRAANSGGGVFCLISSAIISNNTIAKNKAAINGGGIYCSASFSTISNNTIVANGAKEGGGISYSCFSPEIYNNIVAFNSSGISGSEEYHDIVSKCNCFYNPDGDNYSGVSPGEGDIQVDPMFVNVSADDYHIKEGSPCIDRGDDSVVKDGWVDMDGQPRIYGKHVDIGAYEWHPSNKPEKPTTKTKKP